MFLQAKLDTSRSSHKHRHAGLRESGGMSKGLFSEKTMEKV
jgi:hypothetical protein